MSQFVRAAAAASRTAPHPPATTGPLVVAQVVRADTAGVWAHVAGETHDRGPLRGAPDDLKVGQDVLIAIPTNSNDPWIVSS